MSVQRNLLRKALGIMIVAGLLQTAVMGESKQLVLIDPQIDLPVITLGSEATDMDKFAAKELQTYLAKITGRSIEVVADTEVGRRKYIAVGPGCMTASINASTLHYEQYIIDISARGIAIVGGRIPEACRSLISWNGTLYGVYDVLEMLGVRWYRPESWGEHVPKLDMIAMDIGRRTSETPAYDLRSGGGFGCSYLSESSEKKKQLKLWRLRNHLTANNGYRMYHSYSMYIPVAEYFEEHPEYFPLINGKRSSAPAYGLCLGNPDVQELFAQKVVAYAKATAQSGFKTISIECNDGNPICECPLCKAMDDPDNPGVSNRMAKFGNIIARKLAAEVPGMDVQWLAYSAHTAPPTIVPELEKNTVIQLCSINEWGDYSKPLLGPDNGWNQKFVDALKGWNALGPRYLLVYDYGSYGWYGPLPVMRMMADRIRKFRQFNVKGMYYETSPHWGPQGINLYMWARLAWDPDLDMDKELNLYYQNYYGPAAIPMKAYHESWMKAIESYQLGVHSGGRGMHAVCTPALLDQLGDNMSMAMALVRNKSLYERRLKGAWAGYEVARRVSNILKTKKAEGKQVDTATGPFAGGRSSYLSSPKADRMFEQLIAFVESFDETGDAVFDQNLALYLNSSVSTNPAKRYMQGDIMENHIFLWRGHEATSVLKDF